MVSLLSNALRSAVAAIPALLHTLPADQSEESVSHPRSTVLDMPTQTDAQTFESSAVSMLLDVGWSVGDVGEWDAAQALFPARVVEFV